MKPANTASMIKSAPATLHADPLAEAPFYIPATGPTTRPRRTLKYGDTFIVIDSHGDIGASSGGPDGLFHADTRFLSRFEFLLNGMQPLLLGSNVRDDNSMLSIDLTNPDIFENGQIVLPKDMLHIVRTIFIWRDTAFQRFAVRNYGDRIVELRLSMHFENDFADLFEVRGIRRGRRGVSERSLVEADKVVLSYRGVDRRVRQTTLTFDPAPTRLDEKIAVFHASVAPGES